MARGYLTLALLGSFLLGADLVQRLLVGPLVTLFPRTRDRVLTWWMRLMAGVSLWIPQTVGGVRLERRASVPGREGVLLVCNHQSLLDIPLAVRALRGRHPRIVTRERYFRGIPLISLLLRLTRAPLVDPGRASDRQLTELRHMAATCTHPLVIFPEGHRSRDGRLQPFKRGGLRVILAARPWTVHLLIVDGLFGAGRFVDLVRELPGLRGHAVSVGPIEWPGPGADFTAFVDELERRMSSELAALRERSR